MRVPGFYKLKWCHAIKLCLMVPMCHAGSRERYRAVTSLKFLTCFAEDFIFRLKFGNTVFRRPSFRALGIWDKSPDFEGFRHFGQKTPNCTADIHNFAIVAPKITIYN